MTFRIIGHSGCVVELLQEYGGVFVRKSTCSPDFMDRLAVQHQKQKCFLQIKLPDGFSTPPIYREHKNGESFHYDMAYINAPDYVSFFTNADIHALHKLCATIQRWVAHCVNESKAEAFPLDGFLFKYHQVKEAIYKNNRIDQARITRLLDGFQERLKHFVPKEPLPVGLCHGDLTLSNMLIHDAEHIIMIDMLDNFVETPLQDMVKLRQDTCFLWSLQFYLGDFNRTHIRAIMRSMDETLDKYFMRYPFYVEYYAMFQVLNHLRILPYAKKDDVIKHCYGVLEKLLAS